MLSLKRGLNLKEDKGIRIYACLSAIAFGAFSGFCYVKAFTPALTEALICAFIFLILIIVLDRNDSVKNTVNTFLVSIDKLEKYISLKKHVSKSSFRSPVFLGKGFEFTPDHARKLNSLIDSSLKPLKDKGHGSAQIHHLEKHNTNRLFLSDKDLTGHTIIFGTTGSGKTRFFDLLITQAIMKDDVVIILDPKGDEDLKNKAYDACIKYKGKDKFKYLDLNSISKSNCTLNPLSSSVTPTQIADRIISMTDPQSNDTFTRFAQEAITAAVISLNFKQEQVTLDSIRRNMTIDSFIEGCMVKLEELLSIRGLAKFRNYYLKCKNQYTRLSLEESEYIKDDERTEDHQDKTDEDTKASKKGKSSVKKEKRMSKTEFSVMMKHLYDSIVVNYKLTANPDLLFLLKQATISEEFFKKTTATLNPMLNSLTLGAKNTLLNGDINAVSVRQIYCQSNVFYCALQSLKDSSACAFLGKLFLSDLSSFASDIYAGDIAKGKFDKYKRVSIFIDEASEVANEALVQLLNKSRGANFSVTIATQTFSDLVKRTGSKEAANQIIGNCNNLISLRLKDEASASYVVSTLQEVSIPLRSVSTSFSLLKGEGSSSSGERLIKAPLFPVSALMVLPDFEFVAKLSDGTFYKGVLPLLKNN